MCGSLGDKHDRCNPDKVKCLECHNKNHIVGNKTCPILQLLQNNIDDIQQRKANPRVLIGRYMKEKRQRLSYAQATATGIHQRTPTPDNSDSEPGPAQGVHQMDWEAEHQHTPTQLYKRRSEGHQEHSITKQAPVNHELANHKQNKYMQIRDTNRTREVIASDMYYNNHKKQNQKFPQIYPKGTPQISNSIPPNLVGIIPPNLWDIISATVSNIIAQFYSNGQQQL
ncbi:hypothetical protein GE061_013632 [Apolygus lucorum]|uniref:Uncharacterized protein n=1 Tax=Apolygus lucorum TaxID=248454 RepID=A0A8S9XR49_APOLU|nr:hypothetical protein GE061_013632 [Apolygus lucorum]